MITTVCQSCDKIVRAEDDDAGLLVKCQYCQADVEMPKKVVRRHAIPKPQYQKNGIGSSVLSFLRALGVGPTATCSLAKRGAGGSVEGLLGSDLPPYAHLLSARRLAARPAWAPEWLGVGAVVRRLRWRRCLRHTEAHLRI